MAAKVPEEDKQAEEDRKVEAEKPGSGNAGPDLFANLPGYSPHNVTDSGSFGQPLPANPGPGQWTDQNLGQMAGYPGQTPGVTPGQTPGMTPGQTPGAMPGQTPGMTPGQTPGAMPGQTPGMTPGQTLGAMPGQTPGMTPGQTLGAMPGQTPGMTPGQTPGMMPGQTPGMTPGQTPGAMPGQTPGQIPGQAHQWPGQMPSQEMPVQNQNQAQTAAEAAAQGWPQAQYPAQQYPPQTQYPPQQPAPNNQQNPYPQLQMPQARPTFPQLQLPAPQNNPNAGQQQAEQRPSLQPMPYVRRNELDEQNQSINRVNQRPASPNNQDMLPEVPENPMPQRGSREEMELINQQFINNQYVPTTPPAINPNDPNKPWNQEGRPQFELFAEGYEEAIQKAKQARDQMKMDGAPPAKPTAWQETFAQVIESQNQSIELAQQAAQAQAAQLAALQQQARAAGDGGPSALSESLSTAPPKEISRGAAALRAAGIYNKDNSQGKDMQPDPGLQLNKKDVFGIIVFNLILAKNIIVDPRTFFERMLLNGQVTEPIVFLVVLELTTSLVRCLTKFSLVPLFAEFLMGMISTILGAFLINFIFQRFDNKSDPYNCLRVICYSKAPMLLGFMALGKFELGAYLAACYTIYLNYLGLSRVYRTPQNTTLIVIVIMAFLGVFFRGGAP